MRVAILSDIHGNLVALKAVLSDLQRRKIEQVLYLGDVAATGPQPCEVIELVQAKGWPCVRGNTDETLAKNIPDIPHEKEWELLPEEDKRRLLELDEWTRKQLRKSDRDYLSTFEPTVLFRPKNGPSFLCYHGSPRSNHEGIFATTPDNLLTEYLEGHEAEIFVGGHTHMQMLRRFRRSIIVNPGSVGLPFDMHPPWVGRMRNPVRAEYAIVSLAGKSLSLEFVSVLYSLGDLERAVRNSGLPNSDWWLSDWY
jgi:predicted phosphodiesterase